MPKLCISVCSVQIMGVAMHVIIALWQHAITKIVRYHRIVCTVEHQNNAGKNYVPGREVIPIPEVK